MEDREQSLQSSHPSVPGSHREPVCFSLGRLSRLLRRGSISQQPGHISQAVATHPSHMRDVKRKEGQGHCRGRVCSQHITSSLWPAGAGASALTAELSPANVLAPVLPHVSESPVRLRQDSLCWAPGRLLYPNCLDPGWKVPSK